MQSKCPWVVTPLIMSRGFAFRATTGGAFRRATAEEMQREAAYLFLCVAYAGPLAARGD